MAPTHNKLRGKIKEIFKTEQNFAKKLNISQKTLGQKLSGKVPFKDIEIIYMALLLEIPPNEYYEYFFN